MYGEGWRERNAESAARARRRAAAKARAAATSASASALDLGDASADHPTPLLPSPFTALADGGLRRSALPHAPSGPHVTAPAPKRPRVQTAFFAALPAPPTSAEQRRAEKGCISCCPLAPSSVDEYAAMGAAADVLDLEPLDVFVDEQMAGLGAVRSLVCGLNDNPRALPAVNHTYTIIAAGMGNVRRVWTRKRDETK